MGKLLVVGAGPGLGAAMARRLAREGYVAGLVARDAERLSRLARELADDGVRVAWRAADLADDAGLRAAVRRLAEPRVDVLHYNASAFRERDPLELTPAELLADVHVGAAGLLSAVQAARPFLAPGGRVVATGGATADRPWPQAASLGVQKAALRNLVGSLDEVLAPHGVRAVSVTVNGTLARGTRFDPDLVADALVAATRQDERAWRADLPYDG